MRLGLVALTFLFAFVVQAQKAFVEDEDVNPAAKAAQNRRAASVANSDLEVESIPTKQKKTLLQERFVGSKLTDDKWVDRAELTLWLD